MDKEIRNKEMIIVNKRLQKLMVGKNYVTEFIYEELGSAYDLKELNKLIISRLPDSNKNMDSLEEVDREYILNKIQFAFDYRGDYGAGMNLSVEEENEIRSIQFEYRNLLCQYLNEASKCYKYKTEEGLPMYPLYWGFSFVIGNYRNWQLLCGVSSD